MREYKFRGKRVNNNKWVYGNLLQRHDSFGALSLIEVQDKETFEIEVHQVYPESVGVYFGWVDSTGTEIFTGDQLEIFWTSDESTCETISYSQEYGYFMYGNNPICELAEKLIESYVIGNIYDLNPPQGNAALNTMIQDPNAKAAEATTEQATEQESAGQQAAQEATQESAEEGTTEG